MKKLSVLKFLLLSFVAFILFFFLLPSIWNKTNASNILFQDNFENGNINGWTSVRGPNLWEFRNVNGNNMFGARINSPSTIIDTVAKTIYTPNYKIDFDYLPITGYVNTNLDFRWIYNSASNNYNPHEVHFTTENSFWTNFGYPTSISSTPLLYNQVNHVTIVLLDQRIQFILNGVKIIDYIDSNYNFSGSEKIGLRISTGAAYPTEVWFDNIVVTGLDAPQINLNVLPLRQTENLWASQTYDGANYWSPSAQTIKSWGCALTSYAMVLKYFGINKLPDNTDLDPGSLNQWLKSNHGYFDGKNSGYVNPIAISSLSKQAIQANNITSFHGLEYSRLIGDNSLLTNEISDGRPVVLEEPGHFIVAKGTNGSTFNIIDPYYVNKTDLTSYNNSFISINRLKPSSTNLSYIVATADKDLNIQISDSNDNRKGEEILQTPLVNDENNQPGGSPLRILYFPKPTTGNYQVTLTSSNTKYYELGLYLYDQDGNLKFQDLSGVISKNLPEVIDINFNNQNSNNSKAEKIVTPQSLTDDLNELKNLNLIKNDGIYNSLLVKGTIVQVFSSINKDISINILKAMLNELNAQRGKHIAEDAYRILLYDVNYLKNNL